MKTMLDILKINETIVYFAYGQVFFTLGVIIALQSRKHSRLALAHHVRWLAAFSIVHGVYEWGHAFIPVQATYLSPDVVATLEAMRTALLVTSFYLLVQFGMLIACDRCGQAWLLRLFPLAVLFAWLALSTITGAVGLEGLAIRLRLPEATDLARILLGFTGAALASLGMVRQARIVAGMGSGRIAWYFHWSALWFALYAIAAGMIASRGEWTLRALSDFPIVAGVLAIPHPVLRSIAGLGIAFGVIRGLGVFQFEADRLIEERDELQRKGEVRGHLLARVIAAQEEERKRVARELHDETGQRLTAVIMGLGAARTALERDALQAGRVLDETRALAVGALQGIRELILGLRPASLGDLGLPPALRRLADDIGRRAGIEIEVDSSALNCRLPAEVETVLFRIAQEGLNNVGHHAAARHAWLRLSLTDREVRVLLEDDGMGFDPRKVTVGPDGRRGLGLLGMQERASLLGGEVTIESAPRRGTRVAVRLPIVDPGAGSLGYRGEVT